MKTKEIYFLEWNGPYDSFEDMRMKEGIDTCSIYLITGKKKFARNSCCREIKYVGITERK